MTSQYLLAVEAIKKWIVRENFPPGTVLPAPKKLALKVGFSAAIVARACLVLISQGVLTRQGYKLMVKATAPEVSGIEGIIFVVSFDEGFAKTTSRILTERGIIHRVVQLSWGKPVEPVLRRIFAQKPAGLILWTPDIKEQAELILQPNCPIVICAGRLRRWEHSSIRIDTNGGTQQALRHLYDLGHRQLAHVSCGFDTENRGMAEAYQMNCLKLDLKESASRIWQAENRKQEVVREAMLAGLRRNSEVTALFCNAEVGICATKTFSVPTELSVVGFDRMPEAAECQPPLTTLAVRDSDAAALWGCTDLISQIQTIQSGRPRRPPIKAMLVPDLILGESTKALMPKKKVEVITGPPLRKKADPAKTWRTVYPFLKMERSLNWRHLDLAPLANHSLSRYHGWLGAEPLEHFPPGLRSIHGVPFQVLDENRNDGHGVITFRSPRAHSAATKELPTRATVRVNSRVKALYFLHGCGYALPVPFAEYMMNSKAGRSSRVALIPLGPSRSMALEQLGGLKPNLQDWWNDDYEHQDFPHAHLLTVSNPAEPGVYERFLYSLEWINPEPEDEIETIEVCVDPTAGPTLALIAVTALLHGK